MFLVFLEQIDRTMCVHVFEESNRKIRPLVDCPPQLPGDLIRGRYPAFAQPLPQIFATIGGEREILRLCVCVCVVPNIFDGTVALLARTGAFCRHQGGRSAVTPFGEGEIVADKIIGYEVSGFEFFS